MKSRTLAVAAVIVTLGFTIAPSAYVTYGRWGEPRTSFYVNPTNRDVSSNALISALQAGMDIWNSQSGTPFRFSYAGQVSDTTNTYDRRNVVIFRNESNGSAIASTYTWRSNGYIVDADVIFWDGAHNFFTGSSGCTSGAYVEDIAAHEFGHALGMSHSTVTGATMYPSYSSCAMHQRTLSSDDIGGIQSLYGTSSATDTAPVTQILAPANGATVAPGTSVTFTGTATDAPDGDLSSRLVWRSNIDGQIGTGASFSRALSTGSHTITATATDNTGHSTTSSRTLTVSSTNTAPTVTITTPANGASVPAGTSMTFSGSATDTQDGNVSSRLVWRSNIDGQIGTGASFTKTLSAGSHTITASATDNGGLTGQKNVSLSITSAPSPSSPQLTVRAYKEKGAQKADLSWSGLAGANVDVYRDNSKVATVKNLGAMTDSINSKGGGYYNYKVCDSVTSTCTNTAMASF